MPGRGAHADFSPTRLCVGGRGVVHQIHESAGFLGEGLCGRVPVSAGVGWDRYVEGRVV